MDHNGASPIVPHDPPGPTGREGTDVIGRTALMPSTTPRGRSSEAARRRRWWIIGIVGVGLATAW
ncbi:hypothetical protein BJF82_08040 [Kytococcus sp. CUA-901]|nr:hypothetical protein BJF82_08040 [Kytococcus sp. CUA-901]